MGCSQSTAVKAKGPQPSRKHEVMPNDKPDQQPTDNGHIPSRDSPHSLEEEPISPEVASKYIREQTGLPETRALSVANAIGLDDQGCVTQSKVNKVVQNITDLKKQHMQRLQSQDTENTGRISCQDALALLSNRVPELNDVILQAVLARQSNNGLKETVCIVELLEFCAVVKFKKQTLHDRFQSLDVDSSGDLDVSEILATIMHESGVDEASARDIIQQFDVDQNGTIDTEEFIAMWIRLYG